MTVEEIKRDLYLYGLAPVVVLDDADDAVPLAKALYKGGIRFMEITFRTAAAAQSIKNVAEGFPKMIVGAGTIINGKMAEEAHKAGAQFIVTPGYSQEVVDYCNNNSLAVVPGTTTMTEIMMAINSGCDIVKLFPAELSGGIKYINNIVSVFPNLKFMPSGGIGLENLDPYAAHKAIAATGGSWLAPKKLIKEKNWAEITKICEASVKKTLGFRLLHIGINNENDEAAYSAAKTLSDIVGEPLSDKGSAYFVGDMADVVKSVIAGEHGHIAIETINIDRAMRYFEDRGYTFENIGRDANGKVIACWFPLDQVNAGGFAVHLRRKD